VLTLYPWQTPTARRQLEILRQQLLALNLSSTGIGKTFMTAWGLHELGLPAFVIAPKSVLTNWQKVLRASDTEIEGIINWEALRTGRHEWWNKGWHFKRKVSIVVDEVHRGASGIESQGTLMLAQLRAYPLPKILLSATLAATPLSLRAVGFLAGLHAFNEPSFYDWCLRMGCIRMRRRVGSRTVSTIELPPDPAKGREIMARIHTALAPFVVRLTPDDAPGFPQTEITSKLFDLDASVTKEVAAEYKSAAAAIRDGCSDPRAVMMRARRRAELCKIPILKDLVLDNVAEGRSVVVFLNFRDTMARLVADLGIPSVQIHGTQTKEERDSQKALFQANKVHVCIAQVQAGGVGVDLHDDLHQRPRTSLISPSYSIADMIQCLGRVWRANGTKSLQMFVMLSGTAEERTHAAILRKRQCLDALTDGEYWGTEDNET
jgi:hypothetical protein